MLHSTVTSKGQTTIPEKIQRLCELNRATSWNMKWRETGYHSCASRHSVAQGRARQQQGEGMSSLKFAKPPPKRRVMRVPGEQAKTCRHESDCPLSGTGHDNMHEQPASCSMPAIGAMWLSWYCRSFWQSVCLCLSRFTGTRAGYRLRTRRLDLQSWVEIDEVTVHLDALNAIRERRLILSTV